MKETCFANAWKPWYWLVVLKHGQGTLFCNRPATREDTFIVWHLKKTCRNWRKCRKAFLFIFKHSIISIYLWKFFTFTFCISSSIIQLYKTFMKIRICKIKYKFGKTYTSFCRVLVFVGIAIKLGFFEIEFLIHTHIQKFDRKISFVHEIHHID